MLIQIVTLALSGALGTLARFGLTNVIQRAWPGSFPIGTLAVNLAGCFAFGLLWSIAEARIASAPALRLYALSGFLGAFTTFSTLAFDNATLATRGEWLQFGLNLGLSNALGIVLILLGIFLGRAP
jgi:CrcB protein